MEERSCVSRSRRILNRTADVPFSDDADDLSPARYGVSEEEERQLSQVYCLLASITIALATGSFIIWAYVPEHWLHSVGIYYYPTRYQALPLPSYVMLTIVVAIGICIGLNFLATPPPTTLKSIFDEYSKVTMGGVHTTEADDDDDEQAIESLYDVGTNQVNEMLTT